MQRCDHEHHANTTETARANALTGNFDAPGGNVLLPAVPTRPIRAKICPRPRSLCQRSAVQNVRLVPARWNNVSTHDFYRAVLEGTPYPVRTLITAAGRSDCLLLPLSPPVSCKSFEPVLVKTISGTALTFRRVSS